MTCDQLVTELCEKAEQLVIDHGMLHKDVAKAIRNHLLTKADALPKIPVLYNDCYGGFGLSEEFESFEKGKALSEYEGVMAFGKQLRQQFPAVYKVLYLIEYLDLECTVNRTCKLIDAKSEIQWIRSEQERLKELTGSGTIDTPDFQQYYRAKIQQTSVHCENLSDIGMKELKNDLSEDLSLVSKQILHLKDILSEVPKILQEDILQWAATSMEERKDQNNKKIRSIMRFTGEVSEEPSFMKILCSSTPESWADHRLCREPKLQLAIAYAKGLSQQADSKVHSLVDLNDKSVQDRALWALGSKAASGQHADIQVEWVPQLVTFNISDYDGQQSVHW